jgi:hypothetical protein
MPVTPRSAKLTNGRSQQFTLVDGAGAAVAVPAGGAISWTINPVGAGAIRSDGTYTAPADVGAAAEVTITATPPGGIGESATVQLVPLEVILIPGKVRLGAGEVQRFDAIVTGDPANEVHWTFAPTLDVPVGNLYTALQVIREDRDITVFATSAVDPHRSAQATVSLISKPPWAGWTAVLMLYLAGVFGLVFLLINLWPPGLYDRAAVETKRTARIAAETAEQKANTGLSDAQAALSRSPADETLKKKAADATVAAQNATEARKKALDEEQSEAEKLRKFEDTEVWVPFGQRSREVNLLWMVVVAGAIGSFVYSARSFVDFVGNRMIRASWSAWYLMYPLIGAALALVFYLVVRGGFLTTASKSSDINLYGLVAISGMVGMFSKQATNKLDELFSTMFKADTDDRTLKNKLN